MSSSLLVLSMVMLPSLRLAAALCLLLLRLSGSAFPVSAQLSSYDAGWSVDAYENNWAGSIPSSSYVSLYGGSVPSGISSYAFPNCPNGFHSLDPVADCAFSSAPASSSGLLLNSQAAGNGYELSYGEAAQTGGLLSLSWPWGNSSAWCLSRSGNTSTHCVPVFGDSSDLLTLEPGLSSGNGTLNVSYSFPRGALVLAQLSPLTREPVLWLAFEPGSSSPSPFMTHMLPLSSSVAALVWDDSPEDNSALLQAGLELTYCAPLSRLEFSFTSLTYPTLWTPVSVSYGLQQLLDSQGYSAQLDSATFPSEAEYQVSINGSYSCWDWMQQLLLSPPPWAGGASVSYGLPASLLSNWTADGSLAQLDWFCGPEYSETFTVSSGDSVGLYAAPTVTFNSSAPTFTVAPVPGSQGTALRLGLALPLPTALSISIDAALHPCIVGYDSPLVAALSDPSWISSDGLYSRPAGRQLNFSLNVDLATGLVLVPGTLLSFSVPADSEWYTEDAYFHINASGIATDGSVFPQQLGNWSFPAGALVGRIGDLLAPDPLYFQVFPSSTTAEFVAPVGGPLYLSVWSETYYEYEYGVDYPVRDYGYYLTVSLTATLPLSSLSLSAGPEGGGVIDCSAQFPLHPAGQYGGWMPQSQLQPPPDWAASGLLIGEFYLQPELATSQWAYASLQDGQLPLPLTAEMTGLQPSAPAPPAVLPYNRSPNASSTTFGPGVSYSALTVYSYTSVSDSSQPQRPYWSSGYQSHSVVLSFLDGQQGEGLRFQPGVLETGYVADPATALNSSVVAGYVPSSSDATAWSGLLQLSWSSTAPALILPTAVSYAFVQPSVLSTAFDAQGDGATGLWVLQGSVLSFSPAVDDGFCVYVYSGYEEQELCSTLSGSFSGQRLPAPADPFLNFTLGSLVASVTASSGAVQYLPLFTDGTAAFSVTVPVTGALALGIWAQYSWGIGSFAVQIEYAPPADSVSISFQAYELNVSTTDAASGQLLYASSILLPPGTSRQLLNLSMPGSPLPQDATLTELSLAPVFSISSAFGAEPVVFTDLTFAYTATVAPPDPAIPVPSPLPSTSSSLQVTAVEYSLAWAEWQVQLDAISGWAALDGGDGSSLTLPFTALAGGVLSLRVQNVSDGLCFNSPYFDCPPLSGGPLSSYPMSFSQWGRGALLVVLAGDGGLNISFPVYSSTADAPLVSHLIPACGAVALSLNVIPAVMSTGLVSVYYSYSPPVVAATLSVSTELGGQFDAAAQLWDSPLHPVSLTAVVLSDGSFNLSASSNQTLLLPANAEFNVTSSMTYGCAAWLNAFQLAWAGLAWDSAVVQHFTTEPLFPAWPPLSSQLCGDTYSALTLSMLTASVQSLDTQLPPPVVPSSSFLLLLLFRLPAPLFLLFLLLAFSCSPQQQRQQRR